MEHGCGTDVVAFHCQQAIEKAFKGFLVSSRGVVVEGHSLLKLLKEARKEDSSIPDFTKDCAFVNQYYIETRYPSDDPLIVTDEEAMECLQITEKVLAEVSRKVNTTRAEL